MRRGSGARLSAAQRTVKDGPAIFPICCAAGMAACQNSSCRENTTLQRHEARGRRARRNTQRGWSGDLPARVAARLGARCEEEAAEAVLEGWEDLLLPLVGEAAAYFFCGGHRRRLSHITSSLSNHPHLRSDTSRVGSEPAGIEERMNVPRESAPHNGDDQLAELRRVPRLQASRGALGAPDDARGG